MRNRLIVKVCLLFIVLFWMCLTLSISVNAASGCCAGHGGVKCSVGPDSDGSVVCNDGWRDSSCSYSGMEKCRISLNDDSSFSNSSKNTSRSRNTTKIRNTNSNSLFEGLLVILISFCVICPLVPFFLLDKLSNHFPRKKDDTSRKNTIRNKSDNKKTNISQGEVICPLCGSVMIKRNGRNGYFYGCSNYPRCKGKRSIRYKS